MPLTGELLRSSCDRVQFSTGRDSTLFRGDGSFFVAGVFDGPVFQDPSLESCRRLIDDMEAIMIFVGHWRGSQFVNQQGYRGGGQSEQAQDGKHANI